MKRILTEISRVNLVFISIALVSLALFFYVSFLEKRTQSLYVQITDDSIIKAELNGEKIVLETAKSGSKQAYGLMNREKMDMDKGMLFAFATPREVTFYMKDTLISLDMVFLDEELKVVHIYKNTVPNQTSELYPSTKKANYVIELNAGWSEDSELEIGDKLQVKSIEEL